MKSDRMTDYCCTITKLQSVITDSATTILSIAATYIMMKTW